MHAYIYTQSYSFNLTISLNFLSQVFQTLMLCSRGSHDVKHPSEEDTFQGSTLMIYLSTLLVINLRLKNLGMHLV